MERIWLESYPKGVSADIELDPKDSLGRLLERTCRRNADKNAFSCLGHQMKYREFCQKTEYFAAYLQQSLGLEKGDRIAIMMPNVLQYPIALYGALKSGLVVVNINPLYTAREMLQQLKDTEARVVIILEQFAAELKKIIDDTSIEQVVMCKVGDQLPLIKGGIVNFVIKYIHRAIPKWFLDNVTSFNDALKLGAKQNFIKPEVIGKDLAFIQYTGGTTGISKGVMLTHSNAIANILQCREWMKPVLRKDDREIWITALPLYHIFSLMATSVCILYLDGKAVLVPNPRDIQGFAKLLRKEKFTFFPGVNTLFNALTNNKLFKTGKYPHMRVTLSGGMAAQKVVSDKWKKITGTILHEAYGLTETSPGICIMPVNTKRFTGSIGLPISSTYVEIRDEKGQAVKAGEVGELCVKGPQVMLGYYKNPEATKEVLSEDGWLKTGDMAIMDEKGYVKLVDRIKDMIIVSGFNVYPIEIEEVISGLRGVLEVAVIGVPNGGAGEKVKAFIVRKEGADIDEDAVLTFCKSKLTAYKRPKLIEFVDSLPKTAVGKILKTELRKQ